MRTRKETGRMEVDQYFPPVAGALCWLMKLKGRLTYLVERFKMLDHHSLSGQSACEIFDKYDALLVC